MSLDNVVDLGSEAEVEEADALVLRHAAEQGLTQGIPTMEPESELEREAAESPSRWRRFVDEVKSYKELRHTPYGLTPVLILSLITMFQLLDTQAFSVAGPDIARDLQISISDFINIQRLIGIFAVFAALYAGWWADRHRRIPILGFGTIISGFGGMFSSRGSSLFSLGLPRTVDDVANVGADVPSFALLADYYPPETRGKAFGLYGSLNKTGRLLAIFLAAILIDWYGWRTPTLLFGIPLVVMGIVAMVKLREPIRGYMERKALGADEETARREEEPQSFGEGWRTIWAVRTMRRVFIASTIASGAVGYQLLFSFYLKDHYHLDAWGRSLVALPTVFAGLLGGVYGGAMIDKFTRRSPGKVLNVFAIFVLVQAAGLTFIAFGPPLWVLLVANAVFGFGFAMTGPARGVVFSQVIPPTVRTQGLQMLGLSDLPGLVIFSAMLEVVFAKYGYRSAFLFDIPFLVLGAILYLTAGGFFDLDARSAFAASLAADEWRKAKAAGKGKLLTCRDIDVAYDGVQVLFGVDFDVHEGEIIALLGTNGAGKSTLLRAISGTQEASAGAIVFDGRDITHMPPHEISARGVIHMPGGRGVFPGLTVRDNLLLANWMTDDPEEIKTRLAEVFEIFPALVERADVQASLLSGGEQQQLSLAQAFLAKPRLLLIDELSLGLSPAVVGHLLEIVREIHRRGVTIVVVEQSVNVALTIAEKAIFMEKGEVKFFGDTEDLLARPDILRAVYVKGTAALGAGGGASARRSERDQRAMGLSEARPALEVAGLTKRYGGITAVDDVSFVLREGEVLGLIGPNGAGKTTIFDLISGYSSIDEGSVVLEGVDVTHTTPEHRARMGMIRRFQDAKLFPALTVFEAVLVSLEQQLEVRSVVLNALGMPQARRAERRLRVKAERLIDLLELGAYRDKFVKELSTGLRRVADLACVMAAEPKVLLLDEPSSGIAQAEAESLAPLLRRIRFETGCSILIIEHDMPLISAVSDELLALERGRVLMRGTPEEVLGDDRVVMSYLGTTEAAINRSGEAKR
ncbi:MAG TPA: MFS transporter [Acidimicrobiales bacterium]|jgi:branched-chain amino acid transport system ATP-binding protein|nr:MFS transporter [Acidimicrobiales bacterium]